MERISPRRRIPRSVGSLMLRAFVVCLVVSHSSSSQGRTVEFGDGAFDEVADQLEVFFSHVCGLRCPCRTKRAVGETFGVR